MEKRLQIVKSGFLGFIRSSNFVPWMSPVGGKRRDGRMEVVLLLSPPSFPCCIDYLPGGVYIGSCCVEIGEVGGAIYCVVLFGKWRAEWILLQLSRIFLLLIVGCQYWNTSCFYYLKGTD